MRFANLIASTIIVFASTSVLAADISKPSLFTSPPSYLKSFPLNTVHTADLIGALGVPDKTATLGATTYASYVLGEGYGRREFVFIITNDVVVDVQYNSQGAYNGDTAKKEQAGDQDKG